MHAALLTVVLLCTAVHAQEGRGRRGAPGAPPDEPDRTAVLRGTLAEEFSEHLADVQKRLNLQPAQQPAWDKFANEAQALMQDQMRGVSSPLEHEDAPHQIDRRVDVVRNRLAAMEDIADAARSLYAVLSEEQRKRADQLLATAVPSLYSGLPDLGKGQGQPRPGKRDKN